MDGHRFDRITKGLAASSSRRRVLAGLGVIAAGSLVAPDVAAEHESFEDCMRGCNTAAKETRQETCSLQKSKQKNACLRGVQRTRAACREICVTHHQDR